jgi:predicted CXXCH cytochrome family protein
MPGLGSSDGGAHTDHASAGTTGRLSKESEVKGEVRAVRRLALLLTGGLLYLLFLAVAPVFADGGPHQLVNNSGTAGISGDCAACHRAHTAQAADLLKAQQPGLCLDCHNGTGATADVVDGYQFVPNLIDGQPTGSILGALRGGGFSYALLDTGGADRLSYSSRNGQTLTFSAAPAAGAMTLTWASFGSFGGGPLSFTATDSAATVQTAANALFGTSATYSGSTSLAYMTGLPAGDANVIVTKSGNNFTFAPHNALRLAKMTLPAITANGSGVSATMTDTIAVGNAGHVGVLSGGEAVTSTHLGAGTVWGNGPQGQGNAGATGVALECTNCHNPHGNGQYRILNTLPGEDWANGTVEETTTLSAAIATTGATSISVTSAADFPEQKFTIKIDSEQMLVTAGMGTTTWTVTRGANSTTAATHLSGATVSLIVASWTAPTNDVEVIDGPALTGIQVHNYTVKPGYLASSVTGAYTLGDYFRYKYDPSGATNFTNFYLLKDPMNSGWNGQTPTNDAAIESIPNTTLTAALAATGSTATSATVASTAGMPTHTPTTEPQPLFLVKIGSEIIQASVTNGTTLKLSRAQYGTTAAPHSSGDAVTVVGTGPSQDNADVPLYNNLGRMTAFCISCHTRYNGWAQNGTSSLNAQTPADTTYGFKHGTTSTGCQQCHVNHGTNAVMSGPADDVLFPDGTAEDSALLKVDNRGTCQLCHDPTGSADAGTEVGTVPGAITQSP